jgi:hypothetical protein
MGIEQHYDFVLDRLLTGLRATADDAAIRTFKAVGSALRPAPIRSWARGVRKPAACAGDTKAGAGTIGDLDPRLRRQSTLLGGAHRGW